MNKIDLQIKDTSDFIFIELGGKRRQLYMLTFFILLLTMLVGLDFKHSFSNKEILATSLFLLVLILTLSVALYNKTYSINKKDKELVVSSFFIKKRFVFSEKKYSILNGVNFTVLSVETFRWNSKNKEYKKTNNPGKMLYVLSVEVDTNIMPICSSKEKSQLESIQQHLNGIT